MAKNLKPCITIINIDGKEARLTYDQMREHLFNNPELWQEGKAERRKIGGKKKEIAPVAEVEMEKYVPLTAKNIEIGKFSKDEALDYETDEKELDSGRMSEYISSMTVDVMDEDGNSIGNLIRLKDEDGIATYQATDVDGNELGKEEFDTKQEAVDAILAAHNKVKEKEFIKEQKRLAKAKEKAEGKQAAPNSPEGIAARIRNKKQRGALSAIDFGISVTVYNGALEFMASQVEKGTKLGNAIANTIKWIDDKMKGEKWNKGAFGKYMNDTYKVTLGDGREVEVVRDDSKETAEVVNGWYQPIEQKVLDSKEESLPANKWAERLKSKEDEDLWTGVRAFLEEKGTERVSRKELLDFIKDNRIEIVTVVKREGGKKPFGSWHRISIEFGRNGWLNDGGYKIKETPQGDYELIYTPNRLFAEEESLGRFDIVKEAEDVAEKHSKNLPTATKFASYQLPGDKENYKEVLVTLPKKLPIPDGNYIVYADKGAAERREYIKGFNTESEAFNWVKENKDKYPYTIDYETRKIVESIESGDVFKSSHFDEPNILVHLRMNTRTDADGNKVLFLEEVQSDWGQKGKKEGFQQDFDKNKVSIEWTPEYGTNVKGEKYPLKNSFTILYNGNPISGKIGGYYETDQDALNYAIKVAEKDFEKRKETKIPTAPFVMDTNAWVKLGLKTALQEAVRQGADKIAWTTGEQQNDRYDLSKQINSASAIKNNDGTYNLIVEDKQGNEIDPYSRSGKKVTPSEMEDIVGKDLTQKLIDGANRNKGKEWKKNMPVNPEFYTVSGIDLKVGGKGMKGFYGSAQEGSKGIIGGVAESLFGQKIGEVKIENGDLTKGKTFDTREEAEEFAKTVRDADVVPENDGTFSVDYQDSKLSTQSSITITPELKAQVEKGLPLFGTQLSPEQKLKQAIDEWKAENKKLGISVNWEKLAETDKKLIKALFNYIKEKIAQGKYSFDDFVREYGNKIKNFEAQKGKWQGLYNKAAKEAETEKPVTPTEEKKEEGRKPVRELPEAPEGQVVKAVLGRSYQATTSEKVAEAMKKSGLFREVRNLDEAFEAGRKFVDELGWDGAYEVFQDLSATVDKGILLPEDTRMGIFNALTEDLQKRIDNPVSVEQQANDAILMAEVMAKGGELVSRGAYRMRVFQEILKRNTVPYQYEKRIKEWKALFPDSEITKELEDKLKAAEERYNNIHKKFIELSEKQRQWEESQAVSDIKEGIESEKKTAKKPIASALKKLAERVRKLGVSRPGMFSAATPASLVWDAAVEAVAITLEAGGSIEVAIKKGIQSIKSSEWYKGLSDKKKKKAESEFVNQYADISEEGVGMVEVVKGNIVVPHNLIRYYVSEGMTDINEIADTILDGLSEKYPDLTQREVRDAITGYARKVKRKTADEINDAINTLKTEGKLRSQLEDLQNGIVKEKSPKLKKVLSERIKNLQKEIDRIHQEMFGHTTRQMSDAERLDAYKKRAAERIKELKEKIANRDFSKKPKRPPVDFDEEANDLAAEKNQLDEEWADMLNEEAARQAGITTKVGKFLLNAWGVPRSVVVGIDFGVGAIQAGLSMFNDRKQTAKAFANAWKALRSTENYNRVDAVLKSDPQYLEAKKAGLKFYSPKDPEAFKGDMVSISALQRAWNEFGETFITEIGPLFGEEKEKQFKNYWKAINPLAALERSQAGLINTLNFGMYLRGAEIAKKRGYNYKTDPKVYDQIANVANTLSRKATIGGLEKNQTFMNTMNALWFSAQNWVSLLKLTSPLAFWYLGSKRAGADKFYQLSPAQQVAAEIMVKAAGTYLSTLLLIKFLTGWEDPDMDDEERKRRRVITVNMTDPRRADYLKVRMPEQTIDPFAGLTQEVILTYRLLQHYLGNRGYVSTKTGIESYLGENNVPSPLGLIGMQAEGKLSPSSRFTYRYIGSRPIKGQPSNIRKMYMSGEEINMEEEFKDLYTNLTYETAKDQFTDYNVLPAAFLSLLGAYGYGFTREERMEEKSISRQIRETTQKGKEYRTYEKAFKNYAKDGDEELAKKVFEKTLGGKSKEAKSIEMIKEISEDGVSDRYKFGLEAKGDDANDKLKYMTKLFGLLKTGIPIEGRTAKEKSRFEKINELSKEQLDRIKSDYKVQYDEVMSAIKVLNALGVKTKSGKPIDYDYKIKDIPWVKAYRKTMLEAK